MMDDSSTVEGGGPQDAAPAVRVGHGPPLPDPQLSRAAQSSWPQVIGIISIVLGALGILYHSCNGVFAPLMPAFFDSMAGAAGGGGGGGAGGGAPPTIEAQAESMRRFAIPTMVNSVAGVGLSILLTCSGVALIRRRRWSRRGALWWSGLKAIHALGASLLGYLVMEGQWQVIANDPAVTGGGGGGAGTVVLMRSFSAASILLGLAFLLAYPVFLTIWFNRRKVIEEVAGWK